MKCIEPAMLYRYLSVMNNGDMNFFLGSGASSQAGIPTGGNMVWEFKRSIYCTENGLSTELFKDLYSESTRNLLQDYFNNQGTHPPLWSPDEYSHYFELCFNTAVGRERFIQQKVQDIKPSLGHLCLGSLFISKKISNIFTTNFDELIESGIKTICPHFSFNVYSTANKCIAPKNDFSSILKLHGDYRYDHIKNTPQELQSLEKSMHEVFCESLKNTGLVVVGYSGSDDSIMKILEERINDSNFLKCGLIWALPNGVKPSNRVESLLNQACQINENSGIVYIQDFDSFMHDIYINASEKNDIIDSGWSDYPNKKLPIVFTSERNNCFIKLNTFESTDLPLCYVFETDITRWSELKELVKTTQVIAALYSQKIYCFGDINEIEKVFQTRIKSSISKEIISNKILYKYDSIYVGMLYSLLKYSFINTFGLNECGRNKYYDLKTLTKNEKYNCSQYDAFEVALSVYKGNVYMHIVPTVYITDYSGNRFEKYVNQKTVNSIVSSIYNRNYNEKLKHWNKMFKHDYGMCFSYCDFSLTFNSIPLSCGGTQRQYNWPTVESIKYDEPIMKFDIDDNAKSTINQLRGVSQYGPLDYSYTHHALNRPSIRIAVVSPKECSKKIFDHLNLLKQTLSPKNITDGFLIPYSGFEQIYKRDISIPTESDKNRALLYPIRVTENYDQKQFLEFMMRAIDRLSNQNDFDIAIIFIPKSFARFREDVINDYNLHDALKLYATNKAVKVQFIEERSIASSDPCKVLWGLSTSLYAKASGVLWQPQAMNTGSAYVGVSYAISKSKGICLGCSQLFDSSGTGIRLLLKKLNDPRFLGSNPYMKCDEAREMMSALRDQYNHWDSATRLSRIVIHKTTPFTQEEIKGFSQALEGIDDVELIQIQEYAPWKAIRYDSLSSKSDAALFAIQRGTVIPLDENSFLLWTHGSIQHSDLLGNRNYYKDSRGIPTPLLVKRFYGKSSGDVLAKEILMLTKMNWNSGDSLYKLLPVTLDFAKVLARMSKQNEAIYNKAYDFRYFM